MGIIFVAGIVVFSGDGSDSEASGIGDATLPDAQIADEDSLVKTISHGETVYIEDHLDEDTWTVVEFTADW